jgi:hypothetical protein
MDRIPKPSTPAWAGPLHGGVTQSIINKFLECPFRFYLYTVLGLEEPEPPHPTLIWGDIFHKGLELIIKHPVPVGEMGDSEYAALMEEVVDYAHTEYPSLPASYTSTISLMLRLYDDAYKTEIVGEKWDTEVEFSEERITRHGHHVRYRGKIDGLSSRGRLAEHKCTGTKFDKLLTRAETPVDFQVNLYCHISGARKVIYDKIRVPEAQFYLPGRRMGEKWSRWSYRIVHTEKAGDYPIASKRHLWFDQFCTTLQDEDIQFQLDHQIEPLVDKLCVWWNYVTSDEFDPNDPLLLQSSFLHHSHTSFRSLQHREV